MKDFFISYNQADRLWAEWIAWNLDDAGYNTVIQAWDFGAGSRIGVEMHRAMANTRHTVLVLTPSFLDSEFCTEEAGAALVQDPGGAKRKVLPVRVADCAPDGWIGAIDYIDLVGSTEDRARDILVGRIESALAIARGERAKPAVKPTFPGSQRPRDKDPDTAHRHPMPFAFSPIDAGRALASRSPIVIAIEEAERPLEDRELLKTERHLTISLTDEQLETLHGIWEDLSPTNRTLAHVWELGRRVWQVLEQAEPRLKHLLRLVSESEEPQPVAWTGRTELLVRLSRLLLFAHTGGDGEVDKLLSVGYGAQYFSPLSPAREQWTIQQRSQSDPSVRFFAIESDGVLDAASAADVDIAMLGADSAIEPLRELSHMVKGDVSARTRIAVGFGQADASRDFIEEALSSIPCVSLGGPGLRDDRLIRALTDAFEALASRQAAPCAVAAVRRAWLSRAHQEGNIDAFLDGVFWSTWSWIGRPLFTDDLGELVPAAYPHLMDLRSVAGEGWYHPRRKGIPDAYEADELARATAATDKFHLYLSGAGGTGKSCFLRRIFELYASRPDVLAVWYRVDAPASDWEDVERRVCEEIRTAAEAQLDGDGGALIPNGHLGKLSSLLRDLAARLRERQGKLHELVLFVDQLERTFESGDEPDFQRLENISFEIVDLLKTVKVGEGVRVFIASRKQYLPDFLRSFREAADSGLEFNVLQTISDRTEQVGFVKRVTHWCGDQKLIPSSVQFSNRAAETLAGSVNGHPLNMMLALIQVLSDPPTEEVTEATIEETRPWERLFDLDLQVAAKDDLDWYFVLAMAHARAEIVRFEEVWWRLRLVQPTLTRRADDLRPKGVLERLWLQGYVGRTIYVRPHKDDPARFVEFFHANLRDYLVKEVMGQGGTDLSLPGRRAETPPVWRALDRLSIAAHEWEQTQQLLPHDDVAVMMAQRDVLVEKTKHEGEPEREPFYLLFLRDAERTRPRLCAAARECLAFSALVHDNLGRWAIETLIPDVDERVECCTRWLQRCSLESRAPILRYLIEMRSPKATSFITALVLDDQPAGSTLWSETADELARPLYAARYRVEVVADVVEAALAATAEAGVSVTDLPERLREFVAVACGANRNELVSVLAHIAARFQGSQSEKLRLFAAMLGETDPGAWLGDTAPRATLYAAMDARDSTGRAPAAIGLLLGRALEDAVDDERVARWQAAVEGGLGISIPILELGPGELEDHQMELRLHGRRVAVGEFHPGRAQILKRHWDRNQSGLPSSDTPVAHNDVLQEVVLWVERDLLGQIAWEQPALDVDTAISGWLEEELRRSIEHFFGFDLLGALLSEITTLRDSSRLFYGVSLQSLRQVVINLVRERVPLAQHRDDIFDELQQLVSEVKDIEILTAKLREHVRRPLCREFSDDAGQVAALVLEEEFEQHLANRVRQQDNGRVLRLDPDPALALASATRGHFERSLRNDVQPVLVCVPTLRLPLARMLQRFDPRMHVLSFTELAPEVTVTFAGMVTEPRRGDDGPATVTE